VAGFQTFDRGRISAFANSAMVGLVFWLAGVLMNCQGQVLLGTLDTALVQSPFLGEDQMAAIMALPDEIALSQSLT
jgi:hypothetical protein